MMTIQLKTLVVLFLLVTTATLTQAALTIDPLFDDGMILQRGRPIAIWGTGTPGTPVEISFAGRIETAIIDAKGGWNAFLPKFSESTEPGTLEVFSGEDRLTINDILIGDVWLCSGQSNMGYKLEKCLNGKDAVKNASDTLLRVNNYRETWEACIGSTADKTSGVAYFFAQKLRADNPDVPIGLIVRALSGSPIEAWTPVASLKELPFCRDAITRFGEKSEEGKRWLAFNESEEEWKRKLRKSGNNRKEAGKKPRFDGSTEDQVLAEIFTGENPGRLWRERIQVVSGYSIAGAVWYQGERNTKGGAAIAKAYEEVLPAMISGWRNVWGQGDFRFLAVQLPTFAKGGDNWKVVQQAQIAGIGEVSNAALVDIRDLPDGGLHPANKEPVGKRLAAIAFE